MTILNAVIQHDRVCIFTDTAWMADDGTVVQITSKFVIGEEFPFLTAFTGSINPIYLCDLCDKAQPKNGHEALSILSQALIKIDMTHGNAADCGLLIAFAEDSADYPVLYLLRNFWTSWNWRFDAYVPHKIEEHIGGQRSVAQILGRTVYLADPSSFDPYQDGVTVVAAQRRDEFVGSKNGRPKYIIGGGVEVGTLTRKSAIIEQVYEWPEDRVGELIQPDASGPEGHSTSVCIARWPAKE